MKKIFLSACTAAGVFSFAVLPSAAMALTPVDASEGKALAVSGAISPGSCTVNFSGGINYGTITSDKLGPVTSGDEGTRLKGQKQGKLTVDCDVPTQVAIELRDNRPQSVAWFASNNEKIGGTLMFQVVGKNGTYWREHEYWESKHFYGLGETKENISVGVYAVFFHDLMVDGVRTGLVAVESDGNLKDMAPFGNGELGFGAFQKNVAFSWGDILPAVAVRSGKSFSAKIQIGPIINGSKLFPRNEKVELDGNSTLVVSYI